MCCRSSSTCPWHMTESTDLVDQLSPLASRPLSCSVRRRLPFPPFWRRGTVASRCGDAVLPHLRVVQSLPLCESGSAASAAAAAFCLLLSPLGAASPALGWCDRDDEQQQGLRLWGIKVRSKRNNLQSDRAVPLICWPEQLLLPFAACRACPLALARWATS